MGFRDPATHAALTRARELWVDLGEALAEAEAAMIQPDPSALPPTARAVMAGRDPRVPEDDGAAG